MGREGGGWYEKSLKTHQKCETDISSWFPEILLVYATVWGFIIYTHVNFCSFLRLTRLFIVISVRFEFHLFIDCDLWYFYAWEIIWIYFCSFWLNGALNFFGKTCFVNVFFSLISTKSGFLLNMLLILPVSLKTCIRPLKGTINNNLFLLSHKNTIKVLKCGVKTMKYTQKCKTYEKRKIMTIKKFGNNRSNINNG